MFGWTGKILCVDLTTGHATTLRPDPAEYHAFIGGRGLAGHLLAPHATRSWDDPDLPLLFMAGPLTGTIAPTSGRLTAMSLSPLTGTAFDSSVGGKLGTQLKRAGWDGILLTGRAPELSALRVADGEARVVPARDLAGRSALAVMDAVAPLVPGQEESVAAVGPAAETGSLLASILVDRHHAVGRGGLGLVMAAKNLKYFTVTGTGRVAVADPKALKAAREDIFRLTAASPALLGEHGFSAYGTGALYDLISTRRMMPTANFRATHYAPAPELNAARIKARFHPHKAGCKGCHVLCKKVADDGRAMPEYETLSHFTALVENRDLETVVAANALCGELGLDTISAASTLACHAEITGRKLAPAEILALIRDMGTGQGLGAELARGSLRYAESHGRPELSMSVKGLELPAYDPRGAYGMALAYAVSTRGGCHLRAYPVSHEILRKPVATDRFSFSGKARIIKIAEDAAAVVDSLTACKFLFFAATLEEYAKALSAVTGRETSAQELLAVGARICLAERRMNAEAGFTAADDDLPARFFAEAGSGGNGIAVPALDREEFLKARDAYYRVRGLDAEGRPTAEALRKAGLA
jgi:aldehyde:ferredoxin oxidoreductase